MTHFDTKKRTEPAKSLRYRHSITDEQGKRLEQWKLSAKHKMLEIHPLNPGDWVLVLGVLPVHTDSSETDLGEGSGEATSVGKDLNGERQGIFGTVLLEAGYLVTRMVVSI